MAAGKVKIKCHHCGGETEYSLLLFKALYYREYSRRPDVAYKIKARNKLQYAVRAGKIKRQPCLLCGDPKAQAHHPDYSKPYEVIWLCRGCHTSNHSALELAGLLSKVQPRIGE